MRNKHLKAQIDLLQAQVNDIDEEISEDLFDTDHVLTALRGYYYKKVYIPKNNQVKIAEINQKLDLLFEYLKLEIKDV